MDVNQRLKAIQPRTTIRQLVLLGCLLISIPLIFTIFNTIFRIEQLSSYLQQAVTTTTDAVDTSRLVLSRTRDLERSAGQYSVLKDDELKQRYEEQRIELSSARSALLQAVPDDELIREQMLELQQAEEALYQRVTDIVSSEVPTELSPNELGLSRLVQDLPSEVNALVNSTTRQVNDSIQSMIKRLFWQAVLLVPLFVLLAFVFSYFVTRPMRSMDKAVRHLGEGNFDNKINIEGPRDMRELGQRLEWLRKRLTELDQQKLTFLHHVSHELKTPLTSIREGVGLLEEEVVGELNLEQQKVASIIKENSLQLQQEVEALLNFNSAIAGNEVDLENLELSTLIQETVTQQRLAARARGISFDIKIEKVIVSGDWQQLRTLISNLLSNAIKYSPDKTTIEIKLGMLNKQAVLDVIDQGPGISEEDRIRIFEPFYQGQRLARGHIKGTGLGLAIAHQYAQAHFRLSLPLYVSGENYAATA